MKGLLMGYTPDAEQISRALFETDPMHTCCVENECWDEYDTVAVQAAGYLADGCNLRQALHKALQDSFGAELIAGRDLSAALARLGTGSATQDGRHRAEGNGRPYPEYLETFSDVGPIKVRVRFAEGPAWISGRRMRAEEIASLIDAATGDFFTEMTFDDSPHQITRIELSLLRNTLTLHARALEPERTENEHGLPLC